MCQSVEIGPIRSNLSQNNLSNLPAEMLVTIFQYLSISDLCRATLVNHCFRTIARDVMQMKARRLGFDCSEKKEFQRCLLRLQRSAEYIRSFSHLHLHNDRILYYLTHTTSTQLFHIFSKFRIGEWLHLDHFAACLKHAKEKGWIICNSDHVSPAMQISLLNIAAKNLPALLDFILSMINPATMQAEILERLFFAIYRDHIEIVKVILKSTSPNHLNSQEQSPLFLAAKLGRLEIVDLLLQHGANPNFYPPNGSTPLQAALKRSFPDKMTSQRYSSIIQSLIQAQANIHAIGKRGLTTLAYAIVGCNDQMVEWLVKNGADLEARFDNGDRALHLVAMISTIKVRQSRLDSITKYLIKMGADMNALGHGHHTPLRRAVETQSLSLVHILLKSGAHPDIKDMHDHSPLHYAVRLSCRYKPKEKYDAIVKMILSYHPDVNATDGQGNTPLHYAVLEENSSLVDLLIRHQADADQKNLFGISPREMSWQLGLCNLLNIAVNRYEKGPDIGSSSHIAFSMAVKFMRNFISKKAPSKQEEIELTQL